MAVLLFSAIFCLLCNLSVAAASTKFPHNVESPSVLIENDGLSTFTSSNELALVLFYTQDDPQIDPLLDLMSSSGEKLEEYSIGFGVFDCLSAEAEQYCSKDRSGKTVSTFLRGKFLIDLPISSLFSENAILSNTLQLMLLKEVQITQGVEELEAMVIKAIQKSKDLIVIEVPGFGAKGHAEFMQVAHKYLDSGKDGIMFAHTTNSSTLQTQKMKVKDDMNYQDVVDREVHLYYLACSQVDPAPDVKECPVQIYTDLIDMKYLNTFITYRNEKPEWADALSLGITATYCLYDGAKPDEMMSTNMMKIQELYAGVVSPYVISFDEAQKGMWPEWNTLPRAMPGCFIYDAAIDLGEFFPMEDPDTFYVKILKNVRYMLNRRHNEFSTDGTNSDQYVLTDEILDVVESQDETLSILETYLGGRGRLSMDACQDLNRTTFDRESHDGLILFHLKKYDSRSRMIMRLFNLAAEETSATHMYILDCFDWNRVCERESVTQYPAIRLYRNGDYVQYKGDYSVESLVKLSKLAKLDVPHVLKSVDEVKSLFQQSVDGGYAPVFGLFKSSTDNEMKMFEKSAVELMGRQLLAYATGDIAEKLKEEFSLPSLPAVLAYNPFIKDEKEKLRVYDKMFISQNGIVEFALFANMDRFPEVTPTSFPLLRRQNKPMALLFYQSNLPAQFETIRSFTQDSSLKNKFTFAHMNLEEDKQSSLSWYILGKLAPGMEDLPILLVVNYAKGSVFHFDTDSLKKNDFSELVKDWLKSIALGNLKPDQSLEQKSWTPLHPGYDFLRLIDQEEGRTFQHDRLNKQIPVKDPEDTVIDQSDEADAEQKLPVVPPTADSISADMPQTTGHTEL